MVINPNKIY